jgi:sugar phosphate isomerase/epimerase
MLARPPLAVSLAGLNRGPDAPSGPRAAIDWAVLAGFKAVQLDAMAPGLRPRELDRSARRDLAAILRRGGLPLTGLDLWIPPEHLLDPAKAERAMEAILRAVELGADLVRHSAGPAFAAISVVLPEGLAADIASQLARAADHAGVRIADHAIKAAGVEGIHRGVDPAMQLLAGQDPALVAARAGAALASARLSDASLTGRVQPGSSGGRLDLVAYIASLSVAGYGRPIILDPRGLSAQAVRSTLADW